MLAKCTLFKKQSQVLNREGFLLFPKSITLSTIYLQLLCTWSHLTSVPGFGWAVSNYGNET